MVGADEISRRQALLAVGVAVAAIAGVLLLSGVLTDSSGGEDAIDQVPADVDTVVRLDLSITSDRIKQFAAVANGAPLPVGGSGNATDPAAVFNNRTGIDPNRAQEVVVFSDNRTVNGSAYGGAIVHTNAETDAAVEGIQNTTNTSYESTTYNGRTVYTPENASYRYIGVLGDGELVVGTRAAVRDTIDVSEGDADSVGGPLRRAYDDTRNGTVRFATTAPDRWVPSDAPLVDTEVYRDLDTAAGTYYIEDGSAGLAVRLRAPNKRKAGNVRSVTETAVLIANGTVENESARSALEATTVSRDEDDRRTVVVRYEQPFEAFERTVRYLYAEQIQ